jgi:hypothetical protein
LLFLFSTVGLCRPKLSLGVSLCREFDSLGYRTQPSSSFDFPAVRTKRVS